jgi:hypothetical protein
MEITLSELEAKVTEVSFIVIPIQRELFRKKNCKFDRQCHHNTANFPARAIDYAKLFFTKIFLFAGREYLEYSGCRRGPRAL